MPSRLRSAAAAGRLIVLWAVSAILLAPAAALADKEAKPPRDPSEYSGKFKVTVRGFYSGDSNNGARVSANSVRITLQVHDDAGNKGMLIAPNLRMADQHFSGRGTIMGIAAVFEGRVEPADVKNGVLKDARIECTFTAVSGHSGRIVGSRRG